jgi:hypothetical protein
MNPGMPIYIPEPPTRNLDQEEQDARNEIRKRERFANSIWRALPCFVTQSAIERMGLESVATVLEDFRNNLRDYFCADVEFHLARLMEYRKSPQKSPMGYPKPTPEDLYSAQLTVERLEAAIVGIDKMAEQENYAFGAATEMMRPMLEIQLDQSRRTLEHIQSRLDEPDEAGQSSMSNETPASEATKPE